MIVTWPTPVAEMLEESKKTPLEVVPVPHEVPLTVSDPEVVVMLERSSTKMPEALSAPFAAVPVIVTLPAPVAEMLADLYRKTPVGPAPVPVEVPLTVSEPEVVVTQELMCTRTPQA